MAAIAATVATDGNSGSLRVTSGVAVVTAVTAASGDGRERPSAAEPFAWLVARRREGEKAAEVEARAAYLLRFAQDALAALATREPDPFEAAERDAYED
jgi:hypothetical protein